MGSRLLSLRATRDGRTGCAVCADGKGAKKFGEQLRDWKNIWAVELADVGSVP